MKEKVNRMTRMFQLIIAGKSNEETLETIKREYSKKEMGDKVTNMSSVSWTRSQLINKTAYAKKHNPKCIKVMTNAEAVAKTAKKSPAKKSAAKSAPAAKPDAGNAAQAKAA